MCVCVCEREIYRKFVRERESVCVREEGCRSRYLLQLPPPLHPAAHTRNPVHFTLHPTPRTLNPALYTLRPTPYTLHPNTYTLHPTPYTHTLLPALYTREGEGFDTCCCCRPCCVKLLTPHTQMSAHIKCQHKSNVNTHQMSTHINYQYTSERERAKKREGERER